MGEWITVSPWWDSEDVMDEIQSVLDRAETHGPDVCGPVEEYAIHDYEGFPRAIYHEYMGFDAFDGLTEFLRLRDEYGEAVGAYVETYGHELDATDWRRDFEDRYAGTYEDRAAYGHWIASMYDVPDALKYHIDVKGIARDAEYAGDITFCRTVDGFAAFHAL